MPKTAILVKICDNLGLFCDVRELKITVDRAHNSLTKEKYLEGGNI